MPLLGGHSSPNRGQGAHSDAPATIKYRKSTRSGCGQQGGGTEGPEVATPRRFSKDAAEARAAA